jgi:hypothetical protein
MILVGVFWGIAAKLSSQRCAGKLLLPSGPARHTPQGICKPSTLMAQKVMGVFYAGNFRFIHRQIMALAIKRG